MIHLQMEQNKPLWLFVKHNFLRISASEMASMLFLDPYQSRKKLFQNKTDVHYGKPLTLKFVSQAMQNGLDQEKNALDLLCLYIFNIDPLQFYDKITALKPGTIIHETEDLSCSPDAMLSCSFKSFPTFIELYGVEIKTPFSADIPQELEDISDTHYLQCQTSMLVSHVDCWLLFYYDFREPEKSTLFIVTSDHRLHEFLLKKTKEFIKKVKQGDDRDFAFRVCHKNGVGALDKKFNHDIVKKSKKKYVVKEVLNLCPSTKAPPPEEVRSPEPPASS